MKKVEVGKPFVAVIPNGLKLAVQANLSGTRQPTCQIISSNSWEDPKVAFIGQDLIIHFVPGTPPGQSVELVIRENGPWITEEQVEAQQASTFRTSVEQSYNRLFPALPSGKAMTFDQCFYTRGVGQCKLAEDVESLNGPLYKNFQVFGGCGFGAIIAAHFAAGGDAKTIAAWWSKDLKKSLKSFGAFIKGRKNPRALIKVLKSHFTLNSRPILLMDLKADIYIPVSDINGKSFAITKKTMPSMPVYEAVMCSVLDPIEFETKPYIKGMGILIGDLYKSPDWLIYKSNNALKITSIGAPSRLYNHGTKKRSRENLSLIIKENFHRIEQDRSKGLNVNRLECFPIDHIHKFDFTARGYNAAYNSALGAK